MASRIELLKGRIVVNPSELLSRSRATDGDIVVLSGTLLEGFGNSYSDLDLYVIGEHLPTQGPDVPASQVLREDGRVRRVNETLKSSSNVLLDIQYYTFQELETLSRSLNALYHESRLGTRIFRKTLHQDDEDLIHKLLTGTILQDASGSFDARKYFDPATFCFLKYRNEVGGYEEFRDLIGSWMAGDLDTCLYNTRAYLVSQVTGMMFLAGSTNPRPKWFIRKLTALRPEYAELKDGILFWMNSSRHTDLQKREAIKKACELIDQTYAHARMLLGTNARYFPVEEALTLTDREFAERGTPDVDTLAEWQLRRRMFRPSEPPLLLEIQKPPRENVGAAASPEMRR